MTDYLAAEQGIINRLQAVTNYKILTAADLEDAMEGQTPAPAIFVLYAGESNIKTTPNGARVEVVQTWVAVVVVRNTRQPSSGQGARGEAGQMLGIVADALMGQSPGLSLTTLKQVSSPWPPSFDNGFYYYPLAFSTTLRFDKGKD